MREVHNTESFKEAKDKFQKRFNGKDCSEIRECDWSLFKEAFYDFSKYKCPICEDNLSKYDDIDHYRPKSEYEFLECCCENYLAMCADCNRAYKWSRFPLDGEKAKSIEELKDEKPLLVNPRKDDILEYFELLFVMRKNSKKVLELTPKQGINEQKRKMAEETIKTYGIGFCDENKKIDGCRINVLEKHFEDFFQLAKAREKSIKSFLAKLDKSPKKREYGFINFIAKGQFTISDICVPKKRQYA